MRRLIWGTDIHLNFLSLAEVESFCDQMLSAQPDVVLVGGDIAEAENVEACWHEGRISDDDWLPHFTCQAVGDVLFDAMQKHPDRQMTVLCGHTHGTGEAHMLPNLLVKTGGAEYGQPALQDELIVQ
jgi:predicted MPP superfamily phosphohydrolase